MPEFRIVSLSKVKLRVAIEGDGPLVVFVHGFPESWYSWRHQMRPVSEAGYTACAIDVRGYGGSDKPLPVEAYTLEELSGDVAELIEVLRPGELAVVVGHDWGAPIAWTTALVHSRKVRAVAGLSVPYTGIPQRSLREVIDAFYTSKGRFFYQHYFAAEGVAEKELEADVSRSLRRFYFAWSGEGGNSAWPTDKILGDKLFDRVADPVKGPSWLSEADLEYYTGEFERSGFRGPLNRYRNHDRDHAFLQRFSGKRIEQPSLFIGGERDAVLSMFGKTLPRMQEALPDLRGMDILPGCGHWTQQERPREVNSRLIAWLRDVDSPSRTSG
ncbi:alpha/beta fold hydrolase [Bradyrhizobium sp. CSA207]|uniref:alpha/beta fold hydrolase n=1 Tax=Bradyrhizobium sp. CSA207 TaxID=2698826 RepID=UPI0023B16AD4|nr:alpha/beta hydrolase [Bradyrhizobium sp. CSA207]MDE5447078.1 alpha/beta fold hydrolase [Bradyrhizobium sp. CSA207]